MKNIILLLALFTSFSFGNNPFTTLGNFKDINTKHKKTKSFNYIHSFAKQGNANAQFDLALLYLNGNGIQQDSRRAFKWFHRAARQNHVEAKFQMGLNFLKARGVKQNRFLAAYWFKLSSKNGHKLAKRHLANLHF